MKEFLRFKILCSTLLCFVLLYTTNVANGQSIFKPDVSGNPVSDVDNSVQESGFTFKNSESKDGKTAYGFLTFYQGVTQSKGIGNFNIASTNKFNLLFESNQILCAGAYAEGKYYGCLMDNVGLAQQVMSSFSVFDLETGETSKICSFNYSTPVISDMTFDYSNQKMYAIRLVYNSQGECSGTDLIIMNLSDGKWTTVNRSKVMLLTLACTKAGQLYGIAMDGNLYRIDKTNFDVECVGSTGVKPMYIQTMEFDHDDNSLYWVGCSKTMNFFAKVNINTGAIIYSDPIAWNVAGLYIPFISSQIGAPGSVTELTAKPAENGILEVNLSWTNPVLEAHGGNLASILGVKIYRDEKLINSVNTNQVGDKVTYTDKDVLVGKHTYKLIPFNNQGDGTPLNVRAYAGKDKPGTPVNFSVNNVDGNGYIRWDDPVSGINGGWYDKSSLKYKIERITDNKVVITDFKGNEYTDSDVSLMKSYSYRITASNEQGVGGDAVSLTVVLGRNLELPYSFDFKTLEGFDLYTVIDANNDGRFWGLKKNIFGDPLYALYGSYYNTSDDWMITPGFLLNKDKYYKLAVEFKPYGPNYPDNLKITLGKGATAEAQSIVIADYKNLTSQSAEWFTREFIFKTDDDGIYNVGFHDFNTDNKGYSMLIRKVDLQIVNDNDMSALSVSGNTMPTNGILTSNVVCVKNNGRFAQNHYVVQLIDGDGNVLGSKEINEEIQPSETKNISIDWTPQTDGRLAIKCKVVLSGDADNSNDISSELIVDIQTSSEMHTINIADNKEVNDAYPFAFSFKTSVAQSIYLADEMLFEGGMIKELKYFYNFITENVGNKKIKIYMANTSRQNLDEGWVPEDELTLVFDGQVELKTGENVLKVVLDTPFLYAGNNLCIMTERVMDSKKYNIADQFYLNITDMSNPDTRYRSLFYYSDEDNFDFRMGGMLSPGLGAVAVILDNKNGCELSGMVSDKNNGSSLEDVDVIIKEKNISKITNIEGKYDFGYVPEGTYSIQFSKHGYADLIKENIVFKSNESNVCNVDLIPIPTFEIKGRVVDFDGNGVEGADITLNGYDNYSCVTDSEGVFVFNNVYNGENYSIKVFHKLNKGFEDIFSVSGQNKDLGDIKLVEIPFAPYDVEAVKAEGKMDLSWEEIKSPAAFSLILDDNTIENGASIGTGNQLMLGNKFETNKVGVLTSVSVYGLGTSGSGNDKITLEIFDKNREWLASSEPFEFADGWNEIAFDNIVFDGSFYVMMYWNNCINKTTGLALDSNGKNSGLGFDFIYSPKDNSWASCYESTGVGPCVFFIRPIGLYDESAQAIPSIIGNEYDDALSLNFRDSVLSMDLNESVNSDDSNMTRGVEGFKVWRLLKQNEKDESTWTLLTDQVISVKTFSDTQFDNLPAGVYKYAVKAIYSDNNISNSSFSNIVVKDMNTQVTISARANIGENELEGAEVVLKNNDGNKSHVFYGNMDINGQVVIENVWKGTYNIEITKEGFIDFVSENVDLSQDNSYEVGPYSLDEEIITPYNLTVTNNEKEEDKTIHWNVSHYYTDDFESHDDFAINSTGKIGWKYIDGDDSETYGLPAYNYPNKGSKMAFMIFNPQLLNPVMNLKPYSGTKCLVGFASKNGKNNDYLISPELMIPGRFNVEFFAKSYDALYGLEKLEVGYSVTGNDPKDFKWNPAIDVAADVWAKYGGRFPKETKYVAIHYKSEDKMLVLIDDIMIGIQPSRTVQNYKVYLNGEEVTSTNETSFTFTGLEKGRYTAGIKAVFQSGESDLATISFDVKPDGVANVERSAFNVFPNPASSSFVTVESSNFIAGKAEIFDMKGLSVFSKDVTGPVFILDVNKLASGVYMLKITSENGKISTERFVINK